MFVSDPAKGSVTELAADTLAADRTVQVGGQPSSMVVPGPNAA